MVNVVPQLKAGGSFATAAYAGFEHPTAVERIRHTRASISETLSSVCTCARLQFRCGPRSVRIGGAHVTCARTRLKYIGGERAHYLDAK